MPKRGGSDTKLSAWIDADRFVENPIKLKRKTKTKTKKAAKKAAKKKASKRKRA